MLFCVAVSFALLGCLNEPVPENSEYLPLDDSLYPYAGLPRIVIETEGLHDIRDRETEFPSRLQIYGENAPVSEVLELTVRGRGNSSFKMPKYGMKLEFTDKVSFWGMPADRDWALVANFGDKTLLRNFMMTRLSEWLGARYTPRCRFVEVYLNRRYMGLYLLSETVKVSKHRVNIPKNDTTFLIEKESDKKMDPPFVRSYLDFAFHVKYPKNPSEESLELLQEHLSDFERFLFHGGVYKPGSLAEWIDQDDFLLYYWVQEFSKNEDANFGRSIYMTWQKGGKIDFGPLWDFDISFGNESYLRNRGYDGWYIREKRWFRDFFRDSLFCEEIKRYWKENRSVFRALADSVPLYRSMISEALKNEYRRWPIMSNTENWALKDPYEDYDEAIQTMLDWMENRYQWIENSVDSWKK